MYIKEITRQFFKIGCPSPELPPFRIAPTPEYGRSLIFDISHSRSYKISFSSPNSEMECIKYNYLDFCNYLLATANFPFENKSVLLWSISVVTTQNKSHFKTFMVN